MHLKKMKTSLQTKGKNKKNEKSGKFLTRNANSANRPDLSNLRKPIDTSISDLYQVSRLLEDGTDEVKSILSYECNVIYECRVCQSLFRSIVNLVSHKREYCREKFDITLHRRALNIYTARDSITHMFKTEPTSIDSIKNDRILRSQVPKESNKKDLSAVVDMLNKKREKHLEELEKEITISDERHTYLEAIDTNCSAVYQTIESSDAVVDTIDLMKEQIKELQKITDQDALAIEEEEIEQPENQLEKSDSPIQANMSDEENVPLIYKLPMNKLSCSICNAKFSTKKTLTVHMKTLHTAKRLCYPCPCCTNIFANTWSVYRHLYKVHKQNNQQVRKLRSQIQEKAFLTKPTAINDRKSVRAAKALKSSMENSNKTQESISQITDIKPDTKPCGRRGRKSRKASLPTHLQYCQMPVAACDETTIRIKRCNTLSTSMSDDIRCETEDVDLTNMITKSSDDKDISSKKSEFISSFPEICNNETTIYVQSISSLSKECWDMLGNNHDHLSDSVDNDIVSPENIDSRLLSPAKNQDNFASDESIKASSIVCTDANKVSYVASKMKGEEEGVLNHDNEKRLTDLKETDKIETEEDNSDLQSFYSTQSNEKSQIFLMEEKIASIADFRKLRCLLCKRKFTSVTNLRRHMAIHVDWNRYRCKLCDFKCFVKCDCVAHCNKVHNMQNDRTAIAEAILEIPQDEYTCNENVYANVTDLKTKSDNHDVTVNPDVTVTSSCQPEMRVNCFKGFDTHVISQSEVSVANVLVAESREGADRENVGAGGSANNINLSEYMKNSRKLDDPELKRMVMEVIFGSTEVQADADKSVLDTSNKAGGHTDNNIKNVATIDKPREALCPTLNNAKYKRPMRNRIKPLSEDFVYDLKEVAHRKESAFIDDSEVLRKKAKLYH